MSMRGTSLIGTVLAVLRDDPGPHALVRVHLDEMSTPADELVRLLRAHLAAAQPPVDVADLQVVLLPVVRRCAACPTTWHSVEPEPLCPSCGDPALAQPDGQPARIHVELVPATVPA